MPSFNLQYFGKLNLHDLEDFYSAVVKLNGKTVTIELEFEDSTIDARRLKKIQKLLLDLEEYDAANRQFFVDHYTEDATDTVGLYLKKYTKSSLKKKLSTLVDTNLDEQQIDLQLLDKIELIDVHLYPEDSDTYIAFDYVIGAEDNPYKLVFSYDKDLEVDDLVIEN